MVNCDNERCEHNKNQSCILADIYIVDDSCVSKRKKPPDENYTELMRADNPNCHKYGGKYKSNRVGLLK